jgi:hypothetical protein
MGGSSKGKDALDLALAEAASKDTISNRFPSVVHTVFSDPKCVSVIFENLQHLEVGEKRGKYNRIQTEKGKEKKTTRGLRNGAPRSLSKVFTYSYSEGLRVEKSSEVMISSTTNACLPNEV